MRPLPSPLFPVVLSALAAGCGGSSAPQIPACDPSAAGSCASGLVCEQVPGGQPTCFTPLLVAGRVFDLANANAATNGVAGARVVALDANRAPASKVAVSGTNGAYQLQVPWPRNADGSPTVGSIALRADATGFQTFPSGLRLAFPINATSAVKGATAWTIQSVRTDVGLIALASTANLAAIHGTVAAPPGGVGLLVVVSPTGSTQSGVGFTGVPDKDGSYAIFNLPAAVAPGTAYDIQAYGAGANYNPGAATLVPGDDKAVNLTLKNTAAATVSGSVNITGQNLPASPATSVILVVKSTFDPSLARGEAPPGLRVGNITGAYSVPGVPDGTYVVLAAFENDGMVRDVSGIGGTAAVEVVVSGGAVSSCSNTCQFKVTGAVTLDAPFVAPYDTTPWPATSVTPTFTWSAYPSVEDYVVSVIDAFGNQALAPTTVAPVAGQQQSFTYPGSAAALVSGMYYQFRVQVTQLGVTGPASQSEDLKGVFYLP